MTLPILNLFRDGDIEQRCETLSEQEARCMATRDADGPWRWSCEDCQNFGTESDGGEPEYAVSWPVCHKFPGHENLKSFPFKVAPRRCFSLDFWASPFAGMLDGSDENHDRVVALWHECDDLGRPKAASPEGSDHA